MTDHKKKYIQVSGYLSKTKYVGMSNAYMLPFLIETTHIKIVCTNNVPIHRKL